MACRIHSLFELADDYLARADWRDIALLKFCLAALGVLIGISLPKEKDVYKRQGQVRKMRSKSTIKIEIHMVLLRVITESKKPLQSRVSIQ